MEKHYPKIILDFPRHQWGSIGLGKTNYEINPKHFQKNVVVHFQKNVVVWTVLLD